VDAAIRDINGDNVPDLIVADESGVLLYINDSEGQMVYTSGFYTATPRAIGVVDLNANGLFDILVATAQGVRVYIAEDHTDYMMDESVGICTTPNTKP
jgi:bisphosphoglycerate-independent phosphoglycerate mutase (AlkP superfamily)